MANYLQLRDTDFEKAAQNPLGGTRNGSEPFAEENEKNLALQGSPTQQGVSKTQKLPPAGAELSPVFSLKTATGQDCDAESGAVGAPGNTPNPEISRLAELWSQLPELDRQALVNHAEHLVALRGVGAMTCLFGDDASKSRI